MKKIRIIPADAEGTKMFMLFPSAEALYEWMKEPDIDPKVIIDVMGIEEIVLAPADFVEMEWLGCEYVYEGSKWNKLDYVRFAKAYTPKDATGLMVTIHHGWLNEGTFSFNDYSDENFIVSKVSSNEQKLDLGALFHDEDADAEEKDEK